jgi:ATP-dependent helicase/DNAse subunit B
VFFDGFSAFGHPELALIRSIRAHADITVALPRWAGASVARSALLAMGLQENEFDRTVHRFPVRHVVTAPGIEREAAEVARRILAHVTAGRPFRQIGIVLRSREPYVPVLRAALERHGIPARFYFAEPLAGHAMVRYLTGAVEAMLGGWKHEQLLPVLKMATSGFGATAAGDRFDFEVRKQLPGFGLGPLRRLSDHPRLGVLLDRLCGLESWTGARAVPAEWAFRVRGLRCLVQLGEVTDGVPHETAALWRAQARALDAFAAATDEAAGALAGRAPVPFAEYWEAFTTVLENAGLRVPDARRDVVHVMDVYEARQWELPVVFVCGVVEKNFPRYPSADPILPEAARARLQAAGVRLKTAADQRDEEAFLFEIAATRATSELVLTYPEHDAKGDPNLPSFFLDEFGLEPERCAAAPGAAPAAEPERAPYLRDPALLRILGVRHEVVKPSAIESFLGCPFRFFLDHTLGLEPPPALPRARLDARVEGSIVHQTLAEWHRDGESIGDVFDRVFRDACARHNVPPGCRTELARIRLLRDLRRFVAESRRLDGWRTSVEETIEFALDDTVVRGRIDRYDVSPENRAVVFDYKYSREEGIRRRLRGYDEGRAVQGALYLLGLERVFGLEPAGLFYCGLKKDVTLDGWHTSLPEFRGKGTACTPHVLRERLDAAAAITVDAAREIRNGRVEPWPGNCESCEYCSYLDLCRVDPKAEAAAAEGAGE